MAVVDFVGNTRLIKINNSEIDFFDNLARKYKIIWSRDLRNNNIFPISNSVVGFIVTPLQTIELKSKYKEITFNHILRMHLYTTGFSRSNESHILDVKDNSDDFDIARDFLNLLSKEIQVGINREYITEKRQSDIVSGKVNYRKTFVNILKNKSRPISTLQDVLTTDTKINSLLIGALVKLSQSPNYLADSMALKDYFTEVVKPVIQDAEEFYKKINLNSQTARYEELLQLAVLIIDNADYSDIGDNVGVESFLLNFDTLFEQFVIEILKTVDNLNYNLFTTWKRKKNMLDEASFQEEKLYYQPDILYNFVENSPNHDYKDYSYAVLDCKNKAYNVFSNSDIYQVLSYSAALKSKRAILIYPSFYERSNKSIYFDYERFSPSKVDACFINIGENDGDNFLRSIDNFRNKIFDLLD